MFWRPGTEAQLWEGKKQLNKDGKQPPSLALMVGQEKPLAEHEDHAWPLLSWLFGKTSIPSMKGERMLGCRTGFPSLLSFMAF